MKDPASNGATPDGAPISTESGIRPSPSGTSRPPLPPPPAAGRAPSLVPPPPAGLRNSMPPATGPRAPSLPPIPPPAARTGSFPPPVPPASRTGSVPPAAASGGARIASVPPPLPQRAPAASSIPPRSPSLPPAPPPRREDGLQALAKVHAELRTHQIELDRLRMQIKGRDAHIAELKATLAKNVDDVDRARATNADQQRADQLQAQLDERDKQLATLRAQLDEKDKALEALNARQASADLDKTIASLRQQLTAAVTDRETTIGSLRKQLANATHEADARLAALREQMQRALDDKDQQLSALQQQVKQAPVLTSAATGDDLKRIKGIGPGFERVLKANGVTTHAQMAAWTGDDILRFAALLNTQPGRIVRGAWIEQASRLVGGTPEDATDSEDM